MARAAVLCGLGAWTPPHVMTNEMLTAELDTTDEWIRSRTGIRQRHVVLPGTSTGDLAVEAGRRALDSARLSRVDVVVLATSTPDRPCPATAPLVATRLGLEGTGAFDVAAVCTGFIYALATASGLLATSAAHSALVIGADSFSTIMNPADRATRVVFGDGAGAVVLRAGAPEEPGALGGFDLGSDGTGTDLITVPAGGSEQRRTAPDAEESYFHMDGRKVFAQAVRRMSGSVRASLAQVSWTPEELDLVVPHQANLRILHACAEELGVAPERIATNIDRVGNTVAGSLPLALTDAVRDGRLKPDQRVALTAFGGGLTWGSALLRWPGISLPPEG